MFLPPLFGNYLPLWIAFARLGAAARFAFAALVVGPRDVVAVPLGRQWILLVLELQPGACNFLLSAALGMLDGHAVLAFSFHQTHCLGFHWERCFYPFVAEHLLVALPFVSSSSPSADAVVVTVQDPGLANGVGSAGGAAG